MSTDLKVAEPTDGITVLNDLFAKHRIHHIPVVKGKMVVGIVSKSDFLYFMRGYTNNDIDRFVEAARLRAFKVEEIMVKNVETISADAPIRQAVGILAENRFRCLPVVDENGELVGILTTHDIIDLLLEKE